MARPLEEQSQADLIAIIRATREEAAAARKRAEAYDRAFAKLTPGEQAGLLQVIEIFGEDQQGGAELFKQLAESIIDTPSTPQEVQDMSDQSTGAPAPAVPAQLNSDAPPAWAAALVAKIEGLESVVNAQVQVTEQSEVRRLTAEAQSMGFTPGSDQFKELFRIAAQLTDGDLAEAKGWYEAKHGPIAASAAGTEEAATEGAVQQLAAGAPADPAAPVFPPTGAGSAGAAAPAQQAPDLSKSGVKSAALQYLEALGAGAVGTPAQ